jgi:hypothetical protein
LLPVCLFLCRFDPAADEDVREFDAATGVEAAQKQDLDEDEELMVVGDVEKNDKCPYTKKDVRAGRGRGGRWQGVGDGGNVCVDMGNTARGCGEEWQVPTH